ncbi:mandelate racemase/muconate lactonizing enzyme family protein [Pararhizobium sp. DWP3-4]|uniref:mandelate racemase/muconate lactonizing enzyme family protein n=1 Tax=Pararhizobium sp. DWP3-4 TaxID=2804565 RepID=UPI003CF05FB2
MKIVDIIPTVMQAGAPTVTSWTGAGGQSALATGRNWLFVKIITDEPGLIGVGEGSGWPRVIHTAINDLKSELIGHDPRDIERLWQRMRIAMMGHGDTGVVGAGAITAIDMALWDIKGKLHSTPVWNLLGGKVRDKVRYYAHAKNAESAAKLVSNGVTTVKLGGHDGLVERVAEVRDVVGTSIDIIVDLHGPPWLPAIDAIAIGKALEPYNLLFLEDPVAPEDIDGWKRVRRALPHTPLAGGERLATKWGAASLIESGVVDIIQPDMGRAGGITEMKKIAALAEARFIQVAPHSGSLGPVAEYASIHVMAAIPNALLMERLEPEWHGKAAVIHPALESSRGHIIVPDRPGLGVDLVEDFIAAHPSERNVSIATGGWQDAEEQGSTYFSMRRSRANLVSIKKDPIL